MKKFFILLSATILMFTGISCNKKIDANTDQYKNVATVMKQAEKYIDACDALLEKDKINDVRVFSDCYGMSETANSLLVWVSNYPEGLTFDDKQQLKELAKHQDQINTKLQKIKMNKLYKND